MARLTGPDEASRTVFLTVGANKGKAAAQGMSVPLYADLALSTPADVRSTNDQVIAGTPPTLTVDAYSQIPLFKYPDGVDVVYTSINGGPAVPLYARTDDRLDVLDTAVAAAQATAASASTAAAAAETPAGATAKANAARDAAIAAAAPLQYPRSISAGVALAKLYEPSRSLYNGTPTSTARIRAAMARALSGGASARIVCVGDSITYGWGATVYTKRWASLLASMITAKLGASVCGTGAVPLFNYNYAAPWDTRFSYVGGTGATETFDADPGPGIMGNSTYLASGVTATFTPGRTDIDQFIVYYYKNAATAANSLTVKVDNVSVGTINCNQAAGPYGIGSATFTVAAGQAHTLALQATGNYGLLLAVEGRVNTGNGGCNVSIFGNPSHDVQHLVSTGYANADFGPCLTQLAPDLTIIMLETNDYLGALRGNVQTPIVNYKAAWQSAITTAKGAGGDVLIATEWPTSDIRTIPYSDYTRALYELADTNDVPLVDNIAAAGTYATAQVFGMNDDAYHPNDRGHRFLASTMYGALQQLSVGL